MLVRLDSAFEWLKCLIIDRPDSHFRLKPFYCGAIIATLKELALKESVRSPNLRAIVDRIRPALEPILHDDSDLDDEEVVSSCIRANVRASVERLRHGSLILEQLVDSSDLQIVGAEYSIETGTIEFFEDD